MIILRMRLYLCSENTVHEYKTTSLTRQLTTYVLFAMKRGYPFTSGNLNFGYEYDYRPKSSGGGSGSVGPRGPQGKSGPPGPTGTRRT